MLIVETKGLEDIQLQVYQKAEVSEDYVYKTHMQHMQHTI